MSSSVSLQEMKYDVTLPFDQILTD